MKDLWITGRDGDISRQPEERMLMAKVLQHAIDYCKAVKHYGPSFYLQTTAKKRRDNGVHEDGVLARQYFFGSSDDALGLKALCEAFGWNATAFRRRLTTLTAQEASEFGNFYSHFVWKEKQRKENETSHQEVNQKADRVVEFSQL